jgi:hypothetical protein
MLRCPSSANDAGKCPFLRDSALESFHSSGLRMPNTFRTQKASQLRLAHAKYVSYTKSITAQACACQILFVHRKHHSSGLRMPDVLYTKSITAQACACQILFVHKKQHKRTHNKHMCTHLRGRLLALLPNSLQKVYQGLHFNASVIIKQCRTRTVWCGPSRSVLACKSWR